MRFSDLVELSTQHTYLLNSIRHPEEDSVVVPDALAKQLVAVVNELPAGHCNYSVNSFVNGALCLHASFETRIKTIIVTETQLLYQDNDSRCDKLTARPVPLKLEDIRIFLAPPEPKSCYEHLGLRPIGEMVASIRRLPGPDNIKIMAVLKEMKSNPTPKMIRECSEIIEILSQPKEPTQGHFPG